MKIVIFLLNTSGLQIALKIAAHLPNTKIHGLASRLTHSEVDVLFENTTEHIRNLFSQNHVIIGICSAGLLVRTIAPLLCDKHSEPAVIAVAADGSNVVPLVGNHRGANDLAHTVANLLNGQAAITTTGDLTLGIALDKPPDGWILANPNNAKIVMADLIAGASVAIDPSLKWLSALPCPRRDDATIRLIATMSTTSPLERELIFHPQRVIIGVGSDRGCPSHEMIKLVDSAIHETGLAKQSVACIVSIDRKADETAVHAAANYLDVPARFLSADTINTVRHNIPNPSDTVNRETGVPGVAEGAALVASGATTLLLEKRKTARATCAIAISNNIINPSTIGRARGSVAVIGVGPGTSKWRSQECVALLKRANVWVGYDRYLDLISDLWSGQENHRFSLGEEEKRVRHALELASHGLDVALICSGDAGIYAMATLLCEILALDPTTSGLSDAAYRVAVTIVPGISAFQAAAARVGAPVGHDFCCISLSDLLTPWNIIEKRILAAAVGDFVVAFYNPRSIRRIKQLESALDILSKHRPMSTPVIQATNLGRAAENLKVTTLESFEPSQVDMLSIIIVGACSTELFTTGDGRRLVFTPRGYAAKRKNTI
ncbi:MAG: precorrin-3B C(17)-methyltransferase [Hyphomicrobiaceae bacterium]|nr:precorrin-3B C(17)-methyltransferase [Hyphomicrobiaceae bacterium]